MENEAHGCVMEPFSLQVPLKFSNDDYLYDKPDFITYIKQEAAIEDDSKFTTDTRIITEEGALISETPNSSTNFLSLKCNVKTETTENIELGGAWNITDQKLDKKSDEACKIIMKKETNTYLESLLILQPEGGYIKRKDERESLSTNSVDQEKHKDYPAHQYHQYDNQALLEKITSGKSRVLKCDHCEYETIRGYQLKRHQLRHKNPDEVDMFKCDQCIFKTVHKFSLKMHLRRHENTEKVMFKCCQCDYKTIQKANLNRHLLLHRNPEEIDTFKCEQCAYRATNKDNLRKHVVRHTNPQELVRFKCNQCGYQTVRRGDLKKHLIRHRNPEEVDTFKCDQCDYRGILKDNFTKHLLIHKKAEERILYKCLHCDYQAIRKNNLKRHLRRHK